MRESSERLMTLLRGGRCDAAPLWEPWFGMGRMLHDAYGGSYLAMADDLGHAAVPLPGVDTDVMFLAPAERTAAGAYYGGGVLRDPAQLHARPEPDYALQLPKLRATRRAAADAGVACWVVIGWCFDRIAASMGLEQFALDCYDRPESIAEAMEWVEQRNRHAIERLVAVVRPDFVLYNGDCAYRTGLMVEPAMLRRFTWEPTRRTAAMLHALGIPLAFHSDGKLDDLIPMLVELGVTAVHGGEKQANDLAHLVDTFGRDIALCGNMDVVFLQDASPAEVTEQTRQMLATGGRFGRFIAGCNTSPLDYIPRANYVAMCRAIAAAAT